MENKPAYWHETQHSMTRRNKAVNYHVGQRAFMITLKIEDMTPLLGRISASCEDDVRCILSPLGEAMREAWLSLPERFSNIAIRDEADEYVIMPEHFHGIIYIVGYMQEHLSEVIRLFKARIAMSYRRLLTEGAVRPVGASKEWLAAYQALPPEQQAATREWIGRQLAILYSATRCGTQGDSAPFKLAPSGKRNPKGFLFATGYTDGLLLSEENLEGHRQYIFDNPKSRWMRSSNRLWLQVNRQEIDTAVSVPALEGYLRKECPSRDVIEEKLQAVRQLLLCSPTSGKIVCHSYGNRELLNRKLLPIVCHRKDKALFKIQMVRCLQEAKSGTVFVSACISQSERDIFNAIQEAGFPVVRIEDNGFPEIYHPSQERINLCSTSRLLILTPWQYHYLHKDENIFVAYCKTMNCLAQALCRCKDDWWKGC